MTTSNIKQAFVIDGQVFDTRAEATNFLRRPKIIEALLVVSKRNQELADWLLSNREVIEMAFETGTIRRVSKADKNRLTKAVEAVKASGNKDFAFVTENAAQIIESFRWPKVERMSPEEKETAARNTLVAASGGDEKLAKWIMENQESIMEAYKAGIVKRPVSEAATSGLAAYQAKRAAEKAAREAAEADEADAANAE